MVWVANSPLASARAVPVQFVISPNAILHRALHIAGKLDTTDSTARFLLAHLVSLNRLRMRVVLCSSLFCSASRTFKCGKLLVYAAFREFQKRVEFTQQSAESIECRLSIYAQRCTNNASGDNSLSHVWRPDRLPDIMLAPP